MSTSLRSRRSAFISQHLAAAVRHRMDIEGLSHERLAKMAGVPRSSLSEWLGGQTKKCPPADFLRDIFRAVRLHLSIYLDSACDQWNEAEKKKIRRRSR